jgi:Putative MetA-pathway of phenol degradation
MVSSRLVVLTVLVSVAGIGRAAAQERAYFVTYDHYLEERGNLEIAVATMTGLPKNDRAAYTAPWLELEVGLTGWWTAELYLEGVTTAGDGQGFTGWRLEHRFRPLRSEHRVNPVLYVEYERINEASRIQKEIVGAGGIPLERIDHLRRERAHELEGKLILSSVLGAWNLSANFIVAKNLSESEGLEFGYSVGASRSLGTLASGTSRHVCAENFVVGVEAYGGLGSTQAFAGAEQRHYVAPVLGWHVTDRTTLKASAGFGLTDRSDRMLLRVGFAYELPIGGRR